MSHPTLFSYPRPRVDIAEVPAVSHAGAVLLTDTLHSTGLAHSLREALDPWTKPLAEHHAAKVLLDLAMTLTVGGEVARGHLTCCGASRACSGPSPRPRRSRARSPPWPKTPRQ